MRRFIAIAIAWLLLILAQPAFATFPTVASRAQGCQTVNTTSHVFNTSGVTVGSLVLVFFSFDNTTQTPTWPTTIGTFSQLATGTSSLSEWEVRYTTATATSASITITTAGTEMSCYSLYVITGFHPSTVPEAPTAATGATATPDPPLLNPTNWDAEDTLWIAFAHLANADWSITVAPTNYTNLLANNSAGSNTGVANGTAERQLNAASEDPGTFTVSPATNVDWATLLVAVRPAANFNQSQGVFLQ